jgi:hypothetical protein
MHWDAFVAPLGCPLREEIETTGKFRWPEVRPMLVELTDELVAACKEGSLPSALSVDQVWIDSAGKVQLLDFPLQAASADAEASPPEATQQRARADQQSLALLRQIATLTLEGRARSADAPPARISGLAAVPEHAARMLQRLLGVKQAPIKQRGWLRPIVTRHFRTSMVLGHEPYQKPEELLADLAATAYELPM